MTIHFRPSALGGRDATLVIHQNLPPPDHGTALHLTGTGTGTQPPTGHVLTVNVDPAATVTSSPRGIAGCHGTCTGTFNDGTDITLTAAYDHVTEQATWEGCDATSGDTCTIHLTADHTITVSLSSVVP